MKKTFFAATALAVLLGVTSCGGPTDSDPTRPASSTPVQEKPSDPVAAVGYGLDIDNLESKKNDDALHLQFNIRDEKRMYLTVDKAQQDTIDLLRATSESGVEYDRVFVQGMMPTTDKEGNTKPSMVLNAVYDKDTVEKINFDGVKKDNIWELRDSGSVHKDLHK